MLCPTVQWLVNAESNCPMAGQLSVQLSNGWTVLCPTVEWLDSAGRPDARADSASLVQCFSTLCRLYLIKTVFRIFCEAYFVVVKFIILMEGVT